ncbi:MAG: ATP synthase F0 subunit C [Myxococcota bacterium]
MKKFIGSTLTFFGVLLTAGSAFAQEGALNGAHGGFVAIAIALGIGMAAMAGAIGQARTASAALEGIARNPNAADKVFVPMILGLAFIESLVLFTWVLMLFMQNRL